MKLSSLSHEIICNGHPLSVTEKLHHALLRWRQKADVRYPWIDALCINQSNFREREQQVPITGDLIASAEEDIVWLGRPNAFFADFHRAVTTFYERVLALLEERGQDYEMPKSIRHEDYQQDVGTSDLISRLC